MRAAAFRRLSSPRFVASILRNAALTAWAAVSPDEFSRLYRRIRQFTMVSNARLRALYHGIRRIEEDGIPGDVVECGMASGGSAALMALALRELGSSRRLWGFDSFEGMPEPTRDDPDFEVARAFVGSCRGDLEKVRQLFVGLGVSDHSTIVPGRFQDSLPAAGIREIALLHVDADWYESVRFCLEQLYPLVSPGGLIQIDDYGYWEGTRKAVDEFFGHLANPPELGVIDYAGRQASKPRSRGPS
jgi:predicted O-methyltransferase YrrM